MDFKDFPRNIVMVRSDGAHPKTDLQLNYNRVKDDIDLYIMNNGDEYEIYDEASELCGGLILRTIKSKRYPLTMQYYIKKKVNK